MIVVADTSPILNLHRIGRIDLLPALYEQVFIPPAVGAELATFDIGIGSDDAFGAWLSVIAPTDINLVLQLREQLDSGEAEAIALAVERQPTLLLLDEKRGRLLAESLGVTVTGLIGVLANAKQARLINAVKPPAGRPDRKSAFLDRSQSLCWDPSRSERDLNTGVVSLRSRQLPERCHSLVEPGQSGAMFGAVPPVTSITFSGDCNHRPFARLRRHLRVRV